MIKLFSQSNKEVLEKLKPNIEIRSWNDLSSKEKRIIWHHLDWYFFNKNITTQYSMMGDPEKKYFEFYGEYRDKEYKQKVILQTISYLNQEYKAQVYTKIFLTNPNINSACLDFYEIFCNSDEVVALEMLSAYSLMLFNNTKNIQYIHKEESELDKEWTNRKINVEHKVFDEFSLKLNDVFEQFCINYYLTREGFIPRQDKKIINDIYVPVLEFFSNEEKWGGVNSLLSDAFNDFRQKDYSGCITHATSALQGFLQIKVTGKTGKGNISELIVRAKREKIINDDTFTSNIFKNMDSIFAQIRQKEGDAHPKSKYGTEKSARLTLNLVMIFLQHCIH